MPGLDAASGASVWVKVLRSGEYLLTTCMRRRPPNEDRGWLTGDAGTLEYLGNQVTGSKWFADTDIFTIHNSLSGRRRREIIDERRSMQAERAESEGQPATAWTEGIADIAEESFDVLAVTVYDPASGLGRGAKVDC
jgi:hypothetical protein